METVVLVLKLLAIILPIIGAIWWAWWEKKQAIAKAKKETEENAAKEPIQGIDHGTSLETPGTSLENQADKW